ncbi:MAG TPA: tetratricopeptide repeat protein [Vicinamibacteria bacterium]|nr:tetratricopeptide repeat protein [Vicinamibacteria bacterium]
MRRPHPAAAADVLALVLVLAATWAALAGVLGNGFLNWDDPDALVRNPALEGPGLAPWAFTTTHLSHYQPLSWLAWGGWRAIAGPSAGAHHLLSLLVHLSNAALVFLLARGLAAAAGLGPPAPRVAAAGAALLFAVHPLRVEPVAWASAFPYLLALAFCLVSALLYLEHARGVRGPWIEASVVFYALSLLSRAVAPGFPAVLLALDLVLRRFGHVSPRRLLVEKVPFGLLAAVATLVEGAARPFVSLERAGVGARLADAALAPFVYLQRTLWPVGLSPLDPLPLDPGTSVPVLAGGLALLAVLSFAAWRERRRRPALAAAWFSYLVLLGPALGLAPSGLQATADRYTYFAGVAPALLAGAGLGAAWASRARRTAVVAAVVAVVALAAATARQVRYWRDSVTLWTRAVELGPRNDVALYNLAHALEEKGDEAQAARRYEQTLRLLPEHGPARRNLGRIEARRLEREGNDLAASGRLPEAIAAYGRALAQDPARLHARRSRGMALAQLGRLAEAAPDLRAALAAGESEPAVVNALALALLEAGEPAGAVRVLRAGRLRHPEDAAIAHNLDRLLATEEERARSSGQERTAPAAKP